MARLADCLRKAGLSPHETAILKGKVEELRGEDYDAHNAAVEAVKAHLAELQGQRKSVVQQVAAIDYNDMVHGAADARQVADDGTDRLSVSSLATVNYALLLAFGGDPLSAAEVHLFGTGLRELFRLGVPRPRFDGIEQFYSFAGEGANISIAEDPSMRVIGKPGSEYRFGIGINQSLLLQLEHEGDGPAAQVRTAYLAHESWHNADFQPAAGRFESSVSPLFSIVMRDGKRVAQGPVMAEAFAAHDTGANEIIAEVLNYPLARWNSMDPAVHDLLKQEVFAQLGRLWDTNRELLRKELPQAYNLFDRIHDASQSAQTIEDIRSVVRAALRAPGPVRVAAASVDAAAAGADRPGIGVRTAAVGVGEAPGGERARRLTLRERGGQVVGGKGLNRRQLQAVVEKMTRLIDQGIESKDWYIDSAKAILDAADNDMVAAERLTQLFAITSSGTNVKGNTTIALKAIGQFMAGDRIHVGKPEVDNKLNDLLYFGRDWDGAKTSDYYLNITDRMRGLIPDRPVIDRHQFEITFGKGIKSGKQRQYELAQELVRQAASERGLATDQAQAAMWVAKKAQETFAKNRKAAHAGGRSLYKHWSDEKIYAAAYEQAKTSYADEIKDRGIKVPPGLFAPLDKIFSAISPQLRNLTVETVPSEKLKAGQQLLEQDLPTRKRIHKTALLRVFGEKHGEPAFGPFLEAFGVLPRDWRWEYGAGGYNNRINPNVVFQINAPRATVERISKAWQAIFRQDATPFFRADPALLNDATAPRGFWLKLDKALTVAQERDFYTRLQASTGVDFTRMGEREYAIINFGKLSNQEFFDAVDALIPTIPASVEAYDYGTETYYHEADATSGSEQAALLEAAAGGSPALRQRLDRLVGNFSKFVTPVGLAPAEEVDAPKFSLAPPTESEAFKQWFGESKVVDADGKPLVVYHGTVSDFTEFDAGKGHVEADFGAGFYFSNTPEDVARNYAKVGPDLDSKIEQRVERLMNDDQLSEEEARAQVMAELVEHGGATLPVYLALQNPVILGGEQPTYLSSEFEEDTDGGELGAPRGTLVDFAAALGRAANRHYDVDGAQLERAVLERFAYDGGVDADELIKALKQDEDFGLLYATDENGELASHEIIREALEKTGFDGIIDHEVDIKFGSQRRLGKRMQGMHPETVHYIAFQPNQIKSATGNRGTFSPREADIRYAKAEAGVKAAPLAVAKVQQLADDLDAKFPNAAPVIVVPTVADLPFAAQENVRGAFWRGNVYMVAENLPSAAVAQFTYLHEQTGHYGLRGIFGEALNGIMEQIYATNPMVRELADARMARSEGMSKALATEEALADLAGTGKIKYLPQWKMILAAIRKALRDLGLKLDLSDNDIAAILANARKFVEKGERMTPLDFRPALSEQAPPFYSALAANIGKAPFSKKGEIAPSQLRAWLDSKLKEGLFKRDELEWSGLNELLSMTAEPTLTRDEINTFLDQHRTRVGEQLRGIERGELPAGWKVQRLPTGDNDEIQYEVLDHEGEQRGIGRTADDAIEDATAAQPSTMYESYQLKPFGKDYRELLITLGGNQERLDALQRKFLRGELTQDQVLAARRQLPAERAEYTAPHFRGAPPNIVAHVRFNERVGPNGERILFIEEIQSDWAQAGRKQGFAGATPPPVPPTELPADWTVKQYTPRRLAKPAFARSFQEKYSAFIKSGRRANVFGADWFTRHFGEHGSDSFLRLMNLQKTFRSEYGLNMGPGAGAPIADMSGLDAFRSYADIVRAPLRERAQSEAQGIRASAELALEQLDEMLHLLQQRERSLAERKRWGAFDARGLVVNELGSDSKQEAIDAGLKFLHEQAIGDWQRRQSEGTPAGPFVQKTEAWVTLALKRMIRYAAEHGFEQVALITGQQTAERYSMSRQVNEINWGMFGDERKVTLRTSAVGQITLTVTPAGVVERATGLAGLDGKPLDEVIGRELAQKVMADENGRIGTDLNIGGAGHKTFYDRMVRNIANDLLKKHGGTGVTDITIEHPREKVEVPEYEVRQVNALRGGGFNWHVRGPTGSVGPVWRSHGQAQSYAEMLTAEAQKRAAQNKEPGPQITQPGFVMTDKLRESAMAGMPLFSLATDGVMGGITQEVLDRLSWGANKFNWIHKGISTQYHKAQINKWFRPVYQGVQRYMMDTSAMAADAADLAGDDVVPQLKQFSDAFRALPGTPRAKKIAADLKAVSRMVFVATLGDTRPTDVELATGLSAMLKDEEGNSLREISAPALTPDQRAMYERVRASIDLSLAQAAASEMVKLTRSDGIDDARAAAKADPEDAANLLLVALHEKKIAATYAASDAEGEAQTQLQAAADAADSSITKVQELLANLDALKARGYAPLQRFGQYTIDVQQQVEGELQRTAFFMYETMNEANKALRQLREAEPEAIITAGTMNPEAWQGMQGLSLDSLETFAQATGMDTGQYSEAVQDYLKLAASSRSTLKRLIARKGYEGFSEDLPRVLSGFITSQARLASRNYHMGDVMRAQYAIPKSEGETRGEADKLVRYINNPMEEAHVLRGLLFVNFIGGSIASALQNITQPAMMTAPYLAQFGGPKLAGALNATKQAMSHALKVMRDPRQGSPALQAAVAQAAREGVTEPQEIHQLNAEAIRGFGSSLTTRRAVKLWGSAFALAESFNRKLTFNAAFELAEKVGLEAINTAQEELAARRGLEPVTFTTPYEFASHVVTDTQGLYNKGNRPNWARGPIGATAFTFKQFSISYIEFLARLPARERALALSLMVLAAGAGGLPFADDAADLIDTIGQALGFATNTRKQAREWAARTLGEAGGAFLGGGVTSLPGSPVSLAGRFGMGNLIPGTAFFAQSTEDSGRELAQAAGPLGSLLTSAHTAFQAVQGGDVGGAGRAIAPRAIADLWQAINMLQTGYYVDSKGRKVIDTTDSDALFKSIGLQPGAVARAQTLAQGVRQDIALHAAVETAIADRWARGIIDKDPEAVRKAIEDMFAWNLRNPEQRISIQPAQIQRRVREATTERALRLMKSAPKEIRGAVTQALGS